MGRKNLSWILVIYRDLNIDGDQIRVFSESIDPIELKWHRDLEDREIIAVGETDWQIQLDDQLPQEISNVIIKKGVWHRLIKGTNELRIKIVTAL